MPETNPTACLLVIGNEVLSGRTQDANIRFLATGLGAIGIPLREVRVIPDVPHQRMRRRRVRRAVGGAPRGVGAHGAQLQPG